MSYVRKTEDEYILLANYGYGHGWEEETAETTLMEIKQRLKEYRLNAPEYAYTYVKKRVKKVAEATKQKV